jgi:hypothetical protein
MFRNKTTFVLGAGASWHYGYPTGDALIDKVSDKARAFASYCDKRIECGQVIQILPDYVAQKISGDGATAAAAAWKATRDECAVLIERLNSVRPLIIDYFLAWNISLQPIGKLLIAAVILECESAWKSYHRNTNPNATLNDDWYRFVVHKLLYGTTRSMELLENDVTFVTFNYDVSLEIELNSALRDVDFLEKKDIHRFLSTERIIHVYGSVHEPGFDINAVHDHLNAAQNLGANFRQPLLHDREFSFRKQYLDECLSASKNLRTIAPNDKNEDEALLKCARQAVGDAAVVYILGFGFDENNSRAIGLDEVLKSRAAPYRSMMFTNFGNINTVNKKASRLWFRTPDVFLDKSIWGSDPRTGPYIEKSVRTVYDALALDFDDLEGQLMAETRI